MKRAVFLVEAELPEDSTELPSERLKRLIGSGTIVKQLRYKSLSEYEDAQEDSEYWRFG